MTTATKVAKPDRPWVCYSNFLTCSPDGEEHLLRYKSAGFVGDVRGLEGHAFFSCTECRPATYFFAVFSKSPDPHATCYPISEIAFKQWSLDPTATTKTTPEMLWLLRDPAGRSLNPNWKGPR